MRQSEIPFYPSRAGIFSLSVIYSQGATQLAREGPDQPRHCNVSLAMLGAEHPHTPPPPTLTVSVSSPVVPASNPWSQDRTVPALHPFSLL